jgi:hypothetical protein
MLELEVIRVQEIAIRFGVLLLAVCRTAYCWLFFAWSLGSAYMFSVTIRRTMRAHSASSGDIAMYTIFALYSVVFGIAWWMIFRGKPTLKGWAIAANLILVFFFLPTVFWGWRGVLASELGWGPEILVGICGIVIFSIPYHGWRRKPHILVT